MNNILLTKKHILATISGKLRAGFAEFFSFFPFFILLHFSLSVSPSFRYQTRNVGKFVKAIQLSRAFDWKERVPGYVRPTHGFSVLQRPVPLINPRKRNAPSFSSFNEPCVVSPSFPCFFCLFSEHGWFVLFPLEGYTEIGFTDFDGTLGSSSSTSRSRIYIFY